MKKEQLVELGLNDEQIKEVFKLNGQAIDVVRTRLTEIEASNEDLEDKLTELKLTNETLSNSIQGNEDLLSEVETLKQQLTDLEVEKNAQIEQFKFETLLDKKLTESGIRDIDLGKKILDTSNIKYNDGELEGFDEEISRLSESYSYMFNVDNSKPVFSKPITGGGNVKSLQDLSYEDRLSLKRSNPGEYEALRRR